MMSLSARWCENRFQLCRRDWAAIRTFSSTLAFGRMLVIWYDRAMPFWEIRLGGRPVMSSASSRIRPEVGRLTPADREIDIVERGQPAEADGQRLGTQDRIRGLLPLRRYWRRGFGQRFYGHFLGSKPRLLVAGPR